MTTPSSIRWIHPGQPGAPKPGDDVLVRVGGPWSATEDVADTLLEVDGSDCRWPWLTRDHGWVGRVYTVPVVAAEPDPVCTTPQEAPSATQGARVLTLAPTPTPESHEPNADLVARLEGMLEHARSGRMAGLMWAWVDHDTGIQQGVTGAMSYSDLALAHMLMGLDVQGHLLAGTRTE